MKIAILGGAFNPPHFGHLQVSQQVLDFTKTDEVWLMPCYSHPFDKNMDSAKHRLAMTKLCVKRKDKMSGGCRIKVSDWEVKQKKISYSFTTLKALSQEFPQHQFSFIIGSENIRNFKKWKNWKEILKKYKVWVFPRAGHVKRGSKTNVKLLPGMELVKHKFLITSDLASTKIRQRTRKGLTLKCFVPEAVREYIERNKVYKIYK